MRTTPIFLSSARDLWPIGVLSVEIQSDYLYTAGAGGLMNYPMVMTMGVVMIVPPVIAVAADERKTHEFEILRNEKRDAGDPT